MKHANGWVSDPPTLAQIREIISQAESGRITKENLQNFLRRVEGLGYSEARLILEEDFISPVELKICCTDELRRFEQTFPTRIEIIWLKKHNYVLMPVPFITLDNLLGVCKDLSIYPKYKREKGGETEPSWLMLKKNCPETDKCGFNQDIVLCPEYPSIIHIAVGFIFYKKVRGKYPVDGDLIIPSCSVDQNGYRLSFKISEGKPAIIRA